MGRTYVYSLTDSPRQTLRTDLRHLAAAGFKVSPKRCFDDKATARSPVRKRPGFRQMVARLEWEDVVVVARLACLGAQLNEVRATVRRLADQQVAVYCLDLGNADLASSAGERLLNALAFGADVERTLQNERTRAGMARARAKGQRLGRPPKLSAQQQREIRQRHARSETLVELARAYGVSRATIRRMLGAICQ